jgi:hypothetical protein
MGSHGKKCAVALGVLLLRCAAAADLSFPPVMAGIWELKATRTLPSGEVQQWTRTARYCEYPDRLFEGYWGLAALRKAGCHFTSARVSDDTYKVTSMCEIQGGQLASTQSLVTLRGDSEFDMRVEVQEGVRRYGATELGRRIGNCED